MIFFFNRFDLDHLQACNTDSVSAGWAPSLYLYYSTSHSMKTRSQNAHRTCTVHPPGASPSSRGRPRACQPYCDVQGDECASSSIRQSIPINLQRLATHKPAHEVTKRARAIIPLALFLLQGLLLLAEADGQDATARVGQALGEERLFGWSAKSLVA